MKHYLKNLKYWLIHKWYVFDAGTVLYVPFWRLLKHDLSKLTWTEFPHYARFFYKTPKNSKQAKSAEWHFKQAWRAHVERNDHHPEYWTRDSRRGEDMPDVCLREMVADWYGAGKARKPGRADLFEWWQSHRNRITGLIGDVNAARVDAFVEKLSHFYGLTTLKVELTESDIQQGKRDGWMTCPFSLAIRRVLPDGYELKWVSTTSISILNTHNRRQYRIVLPLLIRHMMMDYLDFGAQLKPTAFELYIDSKSSWTTQDA